MLCQGSHLLQIILTNEHGIPLSQESEVTWPLTFYCDNILDCVVFDVNNESSNRQKMTMILFFYCQGMSLLVKKISCEQSGMKWMLVQLVFWTNMNCQWCAITSAWTPWMNRFVKQIFKSLRMAIKKMFACTCTSVFEMWLTLRQWMEVSLAKSLLPKPSTSVIILVTVIFGNKNLV